MPDEINLTHVGQAVEADIEEVDLTCVGQVVEADIQNIELTCVGQVVEVIPVSGGGIFAAVI